MCVLGWVALYQYMGKVRAVDGEKGNGNSRLHLGIAAQVVSLKNIKANTKVCRPVIT